VNWICDEAIRDGSSLWGAQRRSNPEIHDFLDCFVASLFAMTKSRKTVFCKKNSQFSPVWCLRSIFHYAAFLQIRYNVRFQNYIYVTFACLHHVYKYRAD
jgi:hypothetical protein